MLTGELNFIDPDLVHNCLERLSADNSIRDWLGLVTVSCKVKFCPIHDGILDVPLTYYAFVLN